jgi:solute carrier family 36 (proton-coupled amino acid transporter)
MCALLSEDEEERAPAEGEEATETRPLLKSLKRAKSFHAGKGNATRMKAALLLLKSFVGTGVLFLPKAYSPKSERLNARFKNGGMLFSSLLLPAFAMFSLYCFMLLINTRAQVVGSYGEIGGALYGNKMRVIILASIIISQVGFVCAYTIFTAENLSAFVSAVTRGQKYMDVRLLILMQLVILLPCALIRDISKLSGTALIADFFILLGLCVLYYYDIFTLATKGLADIALFNSKDFVLFLGTAAFAFEGIGLIIPIQESMIHPEKFAFVLTTVMIILILVFTSIGALSYAAYGSAVKTVIISSLPQDSGIPPISAMTDHSVRECCAIFVLACYPPIHPLTIISCNPYPGECHWTRTKERKGKFLH